MRTQKGKYTKINTYTHTNDSITEVMLIAIESDYIGHKNIGTPDNFNREHLTNWMKSNYRFNGNEIIAQVPINIQDYPNKAKEAIGLELESIFLEYISRTKDDVIKMYYMLSGNRFIVSYWNLKDNTWKVRKKESQKDISRRKIIDNSKYEKLIWES